MSSKIKIKTMQMQMQAKPSEPIDDLEIHTTNVYSLRPDTTSTVADHTWIAAFVEGSLCHPLTLNPHPYNLPSNFDITKLKRTTLASSYHIPYSPFDKLLVVSPRTRHTSTSKLLAINKGQLQVRLLEPSSAWKKLKYRNEVVDSIFDDIILFKGYIYVVDTWGSLFLINSGKLCMNGILTSGPFDVDGTGDVGWRKRLVGGLDQLYLVVRTSNKSFHVYRSTEIGRGGDVPEWVKVYKFHVEPHVLFVSRDYCFFLPVARKFPGMHLKNSIVFSEGAFPAYGDKFTQSGASRSKDKVISIFRLRDKRFVKEGKNDEFPELDWSLPPWVFDAWSRIDAQSHCHTPSERERVENEGLVVSNRKDENDGGMKSDLVGQDKEPEVMECNVDSRDEEDEQVVDEVAKTLLSMKGATQKGSS